MVQFLCVQTATGRLHAFLDTPHNNDGKETMDERIEECIEGHAKYISEGIYTSSVAPKEIMPDTSPVSKPPQYSQILPVPSHASGGGLGVTYIP